MKKLIVIFTLVIATNVSAAQTLTNPFKISLNSTDGKIDFSEFHTYINIECNYKKFFIDLGISNSGAGITRESCGRVQLGPIALNEKNEIEVPAIEAFKGNKGANLDNYTVQISLSKKVFQLGVKGNYLTIVAEGKKVINQLVNNKEPINFFTLNLDNINVLYKGENFFGSSHALKEKVRMTLRIPTVSYNITEKVRKEKIIIDGRANGDIHWMASAKELNCKVCLPLDQVGSLTTKELSFARLGDKVDTVNIHLQYESQEVTVRPGTISYGRSTTLGETLFQVPLTQEAFESIKEITLVEPK